MPEEFAPTVSDENGGISVMGKYLAQRLKGSLWLIFEPIKITQSVNPLKNLTRGDIEFQSEGKTLIKIRGVFYGSFKTLAQSMGLKKALDPCIFYRPTVKKSDWPLPKKMIDLLP